MIQYKIRISIGGYVFFLNGDKIRLTYVFTKTSDSGYAVCGAEVPHHFPPEFVVCQCVAYCLGTASRKTKHASESKKVLSYPFHTFNTSVKKV